MKSKFQILAVLTVVISNNSFAIDLEAYLSLLENKSIEKIEDAIEVLPTNIRSNYTLMHNPHGLRGGTPTEPTVLAYQPDGKFIVNIGSPNQELGNQIEIIQFKEATRELEMYAIEFPLKKDRNGKIVRPEKNPQTCLNCHGQTPRILWGRYNNWNGAYGGVSGHHDRLHQTEIPLYKIFAEESANKSPYKSLITIEGSEYGPYLPYTVQRSYWAYRPNTKLGVITSHINGQIMAQQTLKSQYYKNYGHLIAALLVPECFARDLVVPKEYQESLIRDLIATKKDGNIKIAEKIKELQSYSPTEQNTRIHMADAMVSGILSLMEINEEAFNYFDGSNFQEVYPLRGSIGIYLSTLFNHWISEGNNELVGTYQTRTWVDRFGLGDEGPEGVLVTLGKTSPAYAYAYSPGICSAIMK